MKGLIARAAASIPRMESGQVERVDRVADVVGKVPFGQPVLQRLGQQHLLLRLVGEIACWHLLTTFTPPVRMTSDFCRAHS